MVKREGNNFSIIQQGGNVLSYCFHTIHLKTECVIEKTRVCYTVVVCNLQTQNVNIFVHISFQCESSRDMEVTDSSKVNDLFKSLVNIITPSYAINT